MLLDAQNLFSDNQEITSGNIISQNVVKFGKGDVTFVPIIIQATSEFKDLTSLKVAIQTSENEQFDNCVTLAESTLLLSQLNAGEKFPLNYLPKGNLGFIRLLYTVEGNSETSGKITAGVVAGFDNNYSV